jgi:hypothetical protein
MSCSSTHREPTRRCQFVIYDLGFTLDTAQFSRDIKASSNVHVLIVKN